MSASAMILARLVISREAERQRIRRDLHDGLGPQLASQMWVLDTVGQLLDQKKHLDALTKKSAALADELEEVTVRLLRAEAELATAKGREAESAKQWLTMSADLSAARARVGKHERLLERTTQMMRQTYQRIGSRSAGAHRERVDSNPE